MRKRSACAPSAASVSATYFITSSIDHLDVSSDNLAEVKAPITAIGGDIGDARAPEEEEEDAVVVVVVDVKVVVPDAAVEDAAGVDEGCMDEEPAVNWGEEEKEVEEEKEFGVS